MMYYVLWIINWIAAMMLWLLFEILHVFPGLKRSRSSAQRLNDAAWPCPALLLSSLGLLGLESCEKSQDSPWFFGHQEPQHHSEWRGTVHRKKKKQFVYSIDFFMRRNPHVWCISVVLPWLQLLHHDAFEPLHQVTVAFSPRLFLDLRKEGVTAHGLTLNIRLYIDSYWGF